MKIIVTGAGGLIGFEAVKYFIDKNKVWGIDNNMRSKFFGNKGCVNKNINRLKSFKNYVHNDIDIRNQDQLESLFKKIKPDVVIHCAAQPSHDKAADIPILDFDVNARGTLLLLNAFNLFCDKDAVFIHMSTNKVYGDKPNFLNIEEKDNRYEFKDQKYFKKGIDENFPIDNSLHSLFGASKLSADVFAQEYGKYFNRNVGVFRGGCLTGPQHSGVELHGFLSYIVKCAVNKNHYTIFGYKGKQVRDQIHSFDVISAFDKFIYRPKKGEVYNIGGGYGNSASILEIIEKLEKNHNLKLNYSFLPANRRGDHICYYSNLDKIKKDLSWDITKSLDEIIEEIVTVTKKM